MTRLCEHAGAAGEEFDVCVIWAFVGGRAVRDCGVESKGEDGMVLKYYQCFSVQ